MLKPRYRNFTESVSDFNRMLDGMNKVQPLEPPRPSSQAAPLNEAAPAVYQADADMRQLIDNMWFYMPGGLKREIQALYAEEQALADIHDKVTQGHVHLTEADRSAIAARHDRMVERYKVMSNEFARISHVAKSEAEKRNYGAMCEASQRKAKTHGRHSQGFRGEAMTESQDPAHLSRYRNSRSALQSFRVLAGLEEGVMMPRDPGLFGTTRFNGGYEEMAEASVYDKPKKTRKPVPAGQSNYPLAKLGREMAAKGKEKVSNPKDPKYKGKGWTMDEGGGSRRSKEKRQMKHYSKGLPADMRPRGMGKRDLTKMEKDVIKQKMRPADESVGYALEKFGSR